MSKDAPPISIRETSSHTSSGSERDREYNRAKFVPISYKETNTGQMPTILNFESLFNNIVQKTDERPIV